jgi:preprotein translocase subunit SecG
MIENKKVITWSLIVLFFTLSIVYSLTYQKKELIFKSTNKSENVYAQTQAEQ